MQNVKPTSFREFLRSPQSATYWCDILQNEEFWARRAKKLSDQTLSDPKTLALAQANLNSKLLGRNHL